MTNLTITLKIKDLPQGIRSALAGAGYTRRDVTLHTGTESRVTTYTNLSKITFCALVPNVNTPANIEFHRGVFGGDNGFNKAPADRSWHPDFDDASHAIPDTGAIVSGFLGSETEGACAIRVMVHPLALARIVAPHAAETMVASDAAAEGRTEAAGLALQAISDVKPGADLSDLDRHVMYAFGGLKGGKYRRDHLDMLARGESWRNMPAYGKAAVEASVESLVSRGYLKRASNGAISMTTLGKSAHTHSASTSEIW